MWQLADRISKTLSDLTVGTVIVLFHVALADRIAVICEGRIMGMIPRAEAVAERIGLLMAGVNPEEAVRQK